jgi:hypothetical protein
MISIQLVPLSLIHQTWPMVEKFIEDGLAWSEDDYTLDQVRAYVAKGEWMLVIAMEDRQIKGAMTVNLYNAPNHRVAFITSTGGRFIINKDTFEQLSSLLRGFGATKVQGVGRDSVVRLLERVGLKKRYTLFEAKL